jgi:ribosomal protein S18 acetylase RimI-like enzyme
MSIIITETPADHPDAVALIAELDAALAAHYPVESRHGYSVDKLLRQGVIFFVVRHDGVPAGCGGVQRFGTDDAEPSDEPFAELKRMYVRPAYRGLGLAKALLAHLEAYTRERGIALLRLETGIYQTEAIGLYERAGFVRIPPFGDYRPDPVSLCYEKRLALQ